MKHRHQLVAAAAFVLAAVIGVAVASMPANQQDAKPPKDPKQDPNPDMQDMPPMPPPPGEHHKWLEKLVGTWTVESEMSGPDMPPMKSTGTDTVRSLGGRWVLCELKAEMPGMGTMSAVLSLGYNTETGKYQGTWIDTVHDHLWVYAGTLDSTGKILTLETEGPNMMDPAKGNTKYRDVIEFKSPDHRTLTSSAHVDGKWVQFVTANYRKTK
jgi:hypothetical protein